MATHNEEVASRRVTRANSKEKDEETAQSQRLLGAPGGNTKKSANLSIKKKVEERLRLRQEAKKQKNEETVDLSSSEDEKHSSDSLLSSEENDKKRKKEKEKKRKKEQRKKQMYFEGDDEVDDQEDSDNKKSKANENRQTNKEAAKEILADPKVTQLKTQLREMCDIPDMGKMRTVTMDRAMTAIQLITIIQRRTTRIPTEVNKELDTAVKVIMESIAELEARVIHAEAKLTVYEEMKMSGQFTTAQNQPNEARQTSNENAKTTSRSYAAAVQNATTTVIIQSRNRNTAEVRRQLNKRTKDYENKIEKVQAIRNGVKITMKNAEEAENLKRNIAQDEDANTNLRIQSAGIRKKRVIIFNVPDQVSEATVKQKLWSTLSLNSINDIREDIVQLLRPIRASNEVRHIPVTLPESLAAHLMKMKSLTFGFQECRIQNYVTVLRCYRCLQFDHIAKDCAQNIDFCSLCGDQHNYKNCSNERRRCRVCVLHNEALRRDGKQTGPIDHSTNSPSCKVYRTLLLIRQIEAEQNKSKFTAGDDVIKRMSWVAWVRGKPTVEKRILRRNNAT